VGTIDYLLGAPVNQHVPYFGYARARHPLVPVLEPFNLGTELLGRGSGSGPAYSPFFKQIAKAVGLARP